MTIAYKLTQYKAIVALFVALAAGMLFAPMTVGAQDAQPLDAFDANMQEFEDEFALSQGNNDFSAVLARIINVGISFLGVIAVIIILAGGFKWMTAGGNEDKVKEAQTMMKQAVVGLVVIFLAYALANFVIEALLEATGQRGL